MHSSSRSNAPTTDIVRVSLQLPSSQQRSDQLTASDSPHVQSQDWNDFFFQSDLGHTLDNTDGLVTLTNEPINIQQPEILDHMMSDVHQNFFNDLSSTDPQSQTGERSLNPSENATAQLCGLTGDMDPYLLRRYRYNKDAEFTFSKLSIRTTQDTFIPVQFLLSTNDLSAESRAETELYNETSQCERNNLSNLVTAEIGARLIQLFFRFVSPQFPILSFTEPPDPTQAPVHLLASIYSISQPFATYDDRLCIDFAYKTPSAQQLFNIAWRSLNKSIHTPTVATVQAALILLLQPPTNELVLDSAFKWALVGSTVSAAQTLGLHLDAEKWSLPTDEVLLRRRLSWAVYSFDKWFALSLGRPSHISVDNWLVDHLTIGDLGHALSSEEIRFCLEFSRLTQILDKVLTQLYSLRAVALLTNNSKATLTISRELLKELTAWYQGLDATFHTNSLENLSNDPDPRFSVHLGYHAVKIIILRALLRPFYHADATPPQDPEQQAEWYSARAHCRLGAKTGANAALGTASLLRASQYQAFWAPWCKTHFALITNLLFFLSITNSPEEAPEGLATLDQARQLYRVQARSFSLVRFALLRIDAVFWVGLDTVINKDLEPS
ncbi:fungal specific transcription factor domain-containing protein [Phlyctema vagabunda]|uniref:Fungal specific transcription factor domain-containing protein n=1 Tax=Phlyctema vagabunda TaxID=108571 RepID=A0ABR4PPX4_9HELO